MHLDTMFLVCPVIFASAFWTGAQAVSPKPSVPERVHALAGSCVVIPCSFTPLAPYAARGRVDVRLKFKAKGGSYLFPLRSTAFNSEDGSQVSRDFQGRTALYGHMADGDCSVKMERVSMDDSHLFEVALKDRDDLLWGRPSNFILEVSDTPEPPVISGVESATEGQLVTLNCTVSNYCPIEPPALLWHWERGVLQGNGSDHGEKEVLHPQSPSPMIVASLSFVASYHVKPRLRCEATYPSNNIKSALKDLHITFPPKDVKVQVQTLTVLEGATALLSCSCKADPPVSDYHWSYTQHGVTVKLHRRTSHMVRLYNVTRDIRVRCSARNMIGQGESHPTPLSVQYKPAILHLSSFCAVEGLEVQCQCSVDSYPRPAVTWSVNGSVPPSGYNMSVTSDHGTQTASLRGHVFKPVRVVCFAVNALGNDSLTLLQGEEVMGSLLWLVIAAVAISLIIIFFISFLVLLYCRRKPRKHVLSRPPPVYPGEMGIYQDRMPLYINCTEVTNIYNNGSYQLVYQNCTPLFVRTKQTRPIGRRGGERRVGERRGGERRVRQGGSRVRETQETHSSTTTPESETAIYLEIL